MITSQNFFILHQHTRAILSRARAQRQQLEQQLHRLEARRRQSQNRARQAALDHIYMQVEATNLAGLPGMTPTSLPSCPTCTPQRS